MTRRERKERKLQKRLDWANSREKKAELEQEAEDQIGKYIPLGQPILTGHHSEKRHRGDLKKIRKHATKAVEHTTMAKHHQDKAANLKRQLETTIFSDDLDAPERLQEKIKKLETERARMKQINKALKNLRERKKPWPKELILSSEEKKILAANNRFFGKYIFPKYMLTNIGQRIRNAKNRLETLLEKKHE